MDYRMIVENAKVAHKELKAMVGAEANESRILVQFKNTEVYQYRCNAEGLAKLMKVDFEEVVMVQFAVGTSKKPYAAAKFAKFYAKAIKMLAYQEVFIAPDKEIATEGDFAWA